MAWTACDRQVSLCPPGPSLASLPNRWESKAWREVQGLGSEQSQNWPQEPGPSLQTPCGPGAVQTLRCEDQVCHTSPLHHVSCYQEADVSPRLASGVTREDIPGLPVWIPAPVLAHFQEHPWDGGGGGGVRESLAGVGSEGSHLPACPLALPVGQR